MAEQSEIKNRLNKIPNSVATSVESGSGIESLIEQIGACLVPRLPEPDQAIPVSNGQVAALEAAVADLNDVVGQASMSESERSSLASKCLGWLESD